MALNHECPNLASLPDEVKKLQQMNDKLFAQMQGCDIRRLGETTFRNGCLARSDSQSTPVSPESKPTGAGNPKTNMVNNNISSTVTSSAGPSPAKSEETGGAHPGTNLSPPAFINPLDYSTHTRLADSTCHVSTRVSPAMKSGSSCTSYIGSFSSSSSPSPSLPDTASFHPEHQSAWKTRPCGSPFYSGAKKPCTLPSDYTSFRKTTLELPPHTESNTPDKMPVKRRGRLRKDAFPSKGVLADLTEPGINNTATELSGRTQAGATKKLTDSLKTSTKRHMSGSLGVTTNARGTVSTAAYKYLTWREKDRRRRFREEWKHLWLVIPHGRYEVMCLVCHKVMTQRKLDTIKRHTVRRHVELLGMPEIDRQNLFEQLIRQQQNLLNTTESTAVSAAAPSNRTSRKTPESAKAAHQKDGSERVSSDFRHISTSRMNVDSAGWQPDSIMMNQISSLASMQSHSSGSSSRTTGVADLANRPGSHSDFTIPPSGLENGPIPSVFSAMTHCTDSTAFSSHMFKRAFEELFADSHKASVNVAGAVPPVTNTNTTAAATATTTNAPSTVLKDSNRPTIMPLTSPSFQQSLPFPTPLSPSTIQKTVLNYSRANSSTSSFTQLLEQLANSRGKIPSSDPGLSPPGGRGQSSALGPNKFLTCDSTARSSDHSAGTNTNADCTSSRNATLCTATTKSDGTMVGGRSEPRAGVQPGESMSESASNMAMAAAAATAQSLLRLPPHLWPHNFPTGLPNKPPEINPMMMATWAAAAVAAAAASGTGNPVIDNATMAAQLSSKFPDTQLMPNPLRLPYPTFQFPPVLPPPTSSTATKFPIRGPPTGPSELRHLPSFAASISNDTAIHPNYSDPSTRLPSGKSMHNHVTPLDFTKLPPYPWNWAFGAPSSHTPSRPPQPDSRSAQHRFKSKSDETGNARPCDFPMSRTGDKNGSSSTNNHSTNTSPSGTAPCLVCTWEEKKREGTLTESDARFVGLEHMPHSCRTSAPNASTANTAGRQKATFDKLDPSYGLATTPWSLPPEAGVVHSRQGSHPPYRSYPSVCDPDMFMKSAPPWLTSFRPPFVPTPGSFDPGMMFYCTEFLRQHCRGPNDLLSPTGMADRQSAQAVSPSRLRSSSRSELTNATTTKATVTSTTSGKPKSTAKPDARQQYSPARSNHSDQYAVGNTDSNEVMERSDEETPRVGSALLASSPRPALSTSRTVDVCSAVEPALSSGLQTTNKRDCLSPLWWVNLTQPGSEQPATGESSANAPGPLNMHMLRLVPGQDLRSCLSYYVTSRHLGGAFVVTCCGSVEGARLRLANLNVKEFHGPFEIVSLVGTLASDGQPHLHLALADSSGTVIGGHLLGPSRIHTTAELVLGVINCDQPKTITEDDSGNSRSGLKRHASSSSTHHSCAASTSSSPHASPSAATESTPMDVSTSAEGSPKKPCRTESPPSAESQLHRVRLVRKADPVTGFKELVIESIGNC